MKVERLGVVTGQSWHGKAAGHGYRSHMFGAVAPNKLFKHTFEHKKKMFTLNEEEYEKMLRGFGNNPWFLQNYWLLKG